MFRVCSHVERTIIAVQIFVINRAFFNMFKIKLENRDFRKSLYFYIVDAEKNWLRALASTLIYFEIIIRFIQLIYGRALISPIHITDSGENL